MESAPVIEQVRKYIRSALKETNVSHLEVPGTMYHEFRVGSIVFRPNVVQMQTGEYRVTITHTCPSHNCVFDPFEATFRTWMFGRIPFWVGWRIRAFIIGNT